MLYHSNSNSLANALWVLNTYKHQTSHKHKPSIMILLLIVIIIINFFCFLIHPLLQHPWLQQVSSFSFFLYIISSTTTPLCFPFVCVCFYIHNMCHIIIIIIQWGTFSCLVLWWQLELVSICSWLPFNNIFLDQNYLIHILLTYIKCILIC